MNKTTSFNTNRHVVYSLYAHLVFVTKYRRKVLNLHILDSMRTIFDDICRMHNSTIIEFEGESDHVHLLIQYPPKLSISVLTNHLKGRSSRLLRIEFKEHISKYYWKNLFWASSYFVSSCGGAPLDVIKRYIQNQQRPIC